LRAASARPVDDADRRLRAVAERLVARVPQLLAGEDRHLHGVEARIRALDPVHVLARGWSITRAADGRLVRSPDDVAAGDVLTTELAGGAVRSRVEPGGTP
jgi:exodeoxyribonuclease VII large subunit